MLREFNIGPYVPLQEDTTLLVKIWTKRQNGVEYIHGRRICGSFTCPDCQLSWPLEQEIEEWTDKGRKTKQGRIIMEATSWGMPFGFCEKCDLAIHGGFDEDYVIRIST
jgi:hypothetical protein